MHRCWIYIYFPDKLSTRKHKIEKATNEEKLLNN